MKYRFWATLKTIFQLDDATFTLLEDCMRNHYDFTVKSCVEHGGFMYGLRGRRNFHKDTPDDEHRNTLELDSKQLQLVMKALEMRNYIVGAQLDELKKNLFIIWNRLVVQSANLNEDVLGAGGDV